LEYLAAKLAFAQPYLQEYK